MCGITGSYGSSNRNVLEKMANEIAHRGPDGKGFYSDDFVSLGHRRLAIIDTSSLGDQPIISSDKRFVLVYNGEVYNFREIKKKLEKKGYFFKSKTDSEVVLYSYIEWKEKCLNMFNGMFAFAIWDKKKKELFLARDRYGIKPLYYYLNNKVFLFGSEIKSFFNHPFFKKELDLETLLEYFTFQNTFSYKTLFKDVKLLQPGHFMKVSSRGIIFSKYWDFDFKEDSGIKSEKECIEEIDRLFNQAVKRQLISDVEIGSYLSGGVDTGSVVAVASGLIPNLKTFCVGFDLSSASGMELSFDERKGAEYISYLYKTEHYEMVLKSGDMQRCLPDLVWHLEDLRVGQSYPNFYASKLASKFVKVCLSGAGGDELFAGYPWRYYRTLKSKTFDEYIKEYYKYWQRIVPNSSLKKLFSPVSKEIENVWTEDIFRGVFSKKDEKIERPEDFIRNSLYFEAKTFLHGLLLVEDKLSMAYGLETRVPFLDNDLVDFAMKIPVKFKLKNIKNVLNVDEDSILKRKEYSGDGKVILRKTLNKYVNGDMVNGKKQGFSGPDASWFKGESIDYVREMLLKKNARIYDFFDYNSASKLIKEHLEGNKNRRLFIWSLLCFEEWNRVFIDKN